MRHRAKNAVLSVLFKRRLWLSSAATTDQIVSFQSLVRINSALTDLVRVGGPGDGGYLIPSDIEGITTLLSPGVSTVCSFDTEIANSGIDVVMADYSVEGPSQQHERFIFFKKFVDLYPSSVTMTLQDMALASPNAAGDLMLQMDIEGAEYRVLSSIPDSFLARFRVMVIEFHGLEQIFSNFGLSYIFTLFDRICRQFNIVHIHPNNVRPLISVGDIQVPSIAEFTFLRKDRPAHLGPLRIPHPMDMDNTDLQPLSWPSGRWLYDF